MKQARDVINKVRVKHFPASNFSVSTLSMSAGGRKNSILLANFLGGHFEIWECYFGMYGNKKSNRVIFQIGTEQETSKGTRIVGCDDDRRCQDVD